MRHICLMYFTFGYGIYFYITWLPTYLLNGRSFSKTQSALLAALPWLFGACGYWFGGQVTDWALGKWHCAKVARCTVGAVGLVASAATLVIVAFTPNRMV